MTGVGNGVAGKVGSLTSGAEIDLSGGNVTSYTISSTCGTSDVPAWSICLSGLFQSKSELTYTTKTFLGSFSSAVMITRSTAGKTPEILLRNGGGGKTSC